MRLPLSQAAKAIYAAVWTGLATLSVTLTGDENLGELSTLQWVLVALAVVGAGGGVYRIPNGKPTPGGSS